MKINGFYCHFIKKTLLYLGRFKDKMEKFLILILTQISFLSCYAQPDSPIVNNIFSIAKEKVKLKSNNQ